MSEIKTGEPVSRFIIHVAASLWATAQVPEITVAIQSLLKAGFRRALQVELLVIIPYRRIPLSEFHYFAVITRTSEFGAECMARESIDLASRADRAEHAG
jgi:hypothetical protein